MAPPGSGFPRPKTKRSEGVCTRHHAKKRGGCDSRGSEVTGRGASRAWNQERGFPGANAGTWYPAF